MDKTSLVSGNILLFYAYDISDDIELELISKKKLLSTHSAPQSTYFKNYHVPLSFRLIDSKDGKNIERQDCILSKLHHFGVLSFCYKISFQNSSFEDLKQKVIEVKEAYDNLSDRDAKTVFKRINPALKKPHFYNLKHDYFAVQVNPTVEKAISADDFKETFGSVIASLLRLETQTLSDYQKDEILESTTGYYGQDFIIIDSEGSFIYDSEYFEPMEFLESAHIQLLELQYYDRVLDKKLNYFYVQKPHKVPLRAYIPLLGRRLELPASRLARLRVDISVITERLESSIKMTGEAYYSTLYSMLVEKLSLCEWRDSINRKLDIIGDLYEVHQGHLDTIHEEILTLVIIVLIALEAVIAFWH